MHTSEELYQQLLLARVPGLGNRGRVALLERFGSARGVLSANEGQLAGVLSDAGVRRALLSAHREPEINAGVQRDLQWLAEGEARCCLTLGDPNYPPRLAEIPDPPTRLFVQGDPSLLATPGVAIVGSRHPSHAGVETACSFAAELASAGLIIASGMARGIDGAAHRGALSAGMPTLAVMGTGPDLRYPPEHRELAGQIVARGALVSESGVGMGPTRYSFPSRNRLISGLTRLVLVVEASEASGSLITADFALEQGREVFAIPGPIHSPLARGCHRLIKQGGGLAESVADILHALGFAELEVAGSGVKAHPESLSKSLTEVLSASDYSYCPMDIMVERTGMETGELVAAIQELELLGMVEVLGGACRRLR